MYYYTLNSENDVLVEEERLDVLPSAESLEIEITMPNGGERVETADEVPLQYDEAAVEESAQLMSSVVASGTCGTNLTWTLDQAGLLTISGSGAMDGYFTTDAPWHSYKGQIRQLVIQNGVTQLGETAFGDCTNMVSATIPEGITKLPLQFFCNCASLTNITFPSSLKRLDNESLWNIGDRDFVVPASVTEVEGHFYGGMSGEPYRIHVDQENPSFTTVNGVMFSKDLKTLVQFPCDDRVEYTVPAGTKIIREHAFMYNVTLQTVTFPASVKAIQPWSFQSLSSLKTIYYIGTREQWDKIVNKSIMTRC